MAGAENEECERSRAHVCFAQFLVLEGNPVRKLTIEIES